MEASRITAAQVKDWCWFNGIETIELWERKAIFALDSAFFKSEKK